MSASVRRSPSGAFETIAEPTIEGLSAAKFVDPATTLDIADQTGSAVAPYATLQQAVNALPSGGGAILCTPGVYPAESIDITSDAFTVQALSRGDAGAVDMTAIEFNVSATLALIGIAAVGAVLQVSPGHSVVDLVATQVVGASGCGTLNASQGSLLAGNWSAADGATLDGSSALGGLSCDGNVTLKDSSVVGSLSVGGVLSCWGQQSSLPSGAICDLAVRAVGYDLTNLTCFSVEATRCHISGTLTIVDSDVNLFRLCTWGNAPVITGPAGATANFDAASYAEFLTDGGMLTGGIQLVIEEYPIEDPQVYDFSDDFDFINGVNGGSISTQLITGAGSWGTSAVGTATLALGLTPVADHPGLCGIRTGATSGNNISIQKGHAVSSANQPYAVAGDLARFVWNGRIPTITSVLAQFGLRGTTNLAVAAVSGVYFEFDSSTSANWRCVCVDASTPTAVDSGVPVVANQFYRLEWQRFGNVVFFFIDRVLVTPGGVSANVPTTGAVNVTMAAATTTNAARGYDVDRCQLQSKRLAR